MNTASAFYDVRRFRADPNDLRIEPWERAEWIAMVDVPEDVRRWTAKRRVALVCERTTP